MAKFASPTGSKLLTKIGLAAFAFATLSLGLAPAPARAADKVETGILGSYTSGLWPYLIAKKQGWFTQAGLDLEEEFAPTAPGLVQQLAAGSLDIVAVNGLAEPLHGVEKGAPVAIMRIIGQVPNYEMIGGKNITDLKQLKGKKIAIGGLRDINKVYLDRVMQPTGLKDGDYDIIVIGATGARFAALQSGAVDATMLVPPFNFTAAKLGFHRLGLVATYAKDLPQTSMQISDKWAKSHMDEAKTINSIIDRATTWLYDKSNRDQAISIMAEASKSSTDDVAQSYDFLLGMQFFAPTSAIAATPLNNMMKDMVALGDMQTVVPIQSLVIPGLNQIEN